MSDEMLINKLKDPSQKRMAFHEMIILYQEKLYWNIRKIVIDHDDTDDILQNVLIKVWNNIESFRGDSELSTWMTKIAINESLSFLSKKKKRKGLFSGSEEEYLKGKLLSDDYFDGEEIQKQLMEAVITLPEKQRIVFNMKYFDEMKYEDISDLLDTSVGALKASYHHAVKKIEEKIKQKIVF